MERTKETYRQLIRTILQTISSNRKNFEREERKRLHDEYWQGNDDFSVLGEIDIEYRFIGYAAQIEAYGHVRNNVEEALANLREVDFLENSRFAEWYFSKREEYPHLIRRAELLDYLRLLCIEYLSKFQAE